MNDNLDIALHYQNQVYDLRIPRMVTLPQLTQLLRKDLTTIGVHLPENIRLRVMNKPLEIDSDVRLSYYPLNNGDQIEVIKDNGED